jgi:hypothetical protein
MAQAAAETPLEAARDLLRRRRPQAAGDLLDAAPAAVAREPAWALLRGLAHARLGEVDAAERLLQPLAPGAEPWAAEATAALSDMYHLTQRHDALRDLLTRHAGWARTPRGRLFQARLVESQDPAQALHGLLALVDAAALPALARIAGFDAVRLLDARARYAEAHALAQRLHAAAPACDVQPLLAELVQQQRLLAKGPSWCPPRAPSVQGTAFIVGLPRSGTTLLEQMLDAHPAVSGIGEHEGLGVLGEALASAGVWPYRLKYLADDSAGALQQRYLHGARRRARAGTAVTLDKSLRTWRLLPALAAVLPGAVALHIRRDPRDLAISAFLSDLDPIGFGWTRQLAHARQVIEAERALVPLALRTLGIAHATLAYEHLVADPRAALQGCLARLGLAPDERVLAPQHNPRAALTLSHRQVRRPVNDAAIGRWRHYAFAFDAGWDDPAQASAAG